MVVFIVRISNTIDCKLVTNITSVAHTKAFPSIFISCN